MCLSVVLSACQGVMTERVIERRECILHRMRFATGWEWTRDRSGLNETRVEAITHGQ